MYNIDKISVVIVSGIPISINVSLSISFVYVAFSTIVSINWSDMPVISSIPIIIDAVQCWEGHKLNL